MQFAYPYQVRRKNFTCYFMALLDALVVKQSPARLNYFPSFYTLKLVQTSSDQRKTLPAQFCSSAAALSSGSLADLPACLFHDTRCIDVVQEGTAVVHFMLHKLCTGMLYNLCIGMLYKLCIGML